MERDPPMPSSWSSSGLTSTVRSQTRVTPSTESRQREYHPRLSVKYNQLLAPKFHQEFAEKINISIELEAGFGDHPDVPATGVTCYRLQQALCRENYGFQNLHLLKVCFKSVGIHLCCMGHLEIMIFLPTTTRRLIIAARGPSRLK